MRVLHVCTEIFPLLKTGGLADVLAGLPPAQVALGCDVRILLPGFPAIRAGVQDLQPLHILPPAFGASSITLLLGRLPDTGSAAAAIPIYVIDAPDLYDRPGNPYADAHNVAYADNDRRFALLGWMAMRLARGLDAQWQPQVVHGHDWHAGLAPAYLATLPQHAQAPRVGTVMTVHNLAYQGMFPAEAFAQLGLPLETFAVDGVEFYGQVSFLKAGLYYADLLTTVSPTYAREIQEPAQGCGLHGLLHDRADALFGILNGVDDQVWNPAADTLIAACFDRADLAGKARCKTALQGECGLAVQPEALLFGVVSRLTEQKGLNLVLAGMQALLRQGGQLVLLGSGDSWMQDAFLALARAHPAQVAVEIGYDEAKAHRIVAGCDVLLVPSLFEPCGLTQMYALNYGALPLVRRVGGLADTVCDSTLENLADDSATGIVFDQFGEDDFNRAVRRAFALRARPADWQQVQQRGMQQHFDWASAARALIALYERTIA